MALALPVPLSAILSPAAITGDALLSESRQTTYRFDLLGKVDDNEALIGQLDGVQSGGYVDFAFDASIKGGGKITVTDVGQDVDWLNVRVRPVVVLSTADSASTQEFPVGVYIPAAPAEKWNEGTRQWDVELLDKASILDQDIPTNVDGLPVTYALDAGTNIIEAVVVLIESANEATPLIQPDDKTLAGPMTWDVGTSKLRIINDLLAAANYFSLFCDGSGAFQAVPYVDAENRPVTYEILDPFSDSITSLMAPDWSKEEDIYSIPNRYVVIGVGDQNTAALVATATNEDAASAYSFPSRGRWITQVDTGVEAASQVELDGIAVRSLSRASSVSSRLEVAHAFLPDLHVNSVIRFNNPTAGLSMKATVTSTNIPFDPLALCATKLSAV